MFFRIIRGQKSCSTKSWMKEGIVREYPPQTKKGYMIKVIMK